MMSRYAARLYQGAVCGRRMENISNTCAKHVLKPSTRQADFARHREDLKPGRCLEPQAVESLLLPSFVLSVNHGLYEPTIGLRKRRNR